MLTTTDQPTPLDLDPDVDDDPDQPGELAERINAIADAERSTELATVDELPVLPGQDEWNRLLVMARTLSIAKAAPAELRERPADMLLVLLTARDLGIKLTEAMRTIYVVEGHVTLAPRLKIALVSQKGLGWVKPCRPVAVLVDGEQRRACPICGDPNGSDDQQATAHAYVAATGERHDFTFTMADAQRAKLVKERGAWMTYPQRMLWWRAAGYLVDDLFPDAAMGIYSPDELGASVDEDGNFIDVGSVELPSGFEQKRRGGNGQPAEMLTDENAAALRERARSLPVGAHEPLAAALKEKLPHAIGSALTAAQGRTAAALIESFEKRAERGEWGPWSPDSPASAAPGSPGDAEGGSDAPEARMVDMDALAHEYDALDPYGRAWVERRMGEVGLSWETDDQGERVAIMALVHGAPFDPHDDGDDLDGELVKASRWAVGTMPDEQVVAALDERGMVMPGESVEAQRERLAVVLARETASDTADG